MQPPPELSNVSQQIGAPPLPQSNYKEQFAKNKNDFLKEQSLRDWEQAALRSYGALAIIRQILGVFFVLVALDATFRLILLVQLQPQLKSGMMLDLFGFIVVGILAVVSFFKLRWWILMATGIAIIPFNYSSGHIGIDLFSITAIALFPCVLGYIIAILMVGLFARVPSLWRANRELYLSASDYDAIKLAVSEIATGRRADLWPEIGKVNASFGISNTVRVRFFDKGALFLVGKNTFNLILSNDADKCVVEVTKKNKKFLKQWPVQGKVMKDNIALTDEGHTRLQQWLTSVTTPALVASA